MSGKDAVILEIGDWWVERDEVVRIAEELNVSMDGLVTDQKLVTLIDTTLLEFFFANKGQILKRVEYMGENYVYGRVSITLSGAPFKTYKRLYFKELPDGTDNI